MFALQTGRAKQSLAYSARWAEPTLTTWPAPSSLLSKAFLSLKVACQCTPRPVPCAPGRPSGPGTWISRLDLLFSHLEPVLSGDVPTQGPHRLLPPALLSFLLSTKPRAEGPEPQEAPNPGLATFLTLLHMFNSVLTTCQFHPTGRGRTWAFKGADIRPSLQAGGLPGARLPIFTSKCLGKSQGS